jgi:AcrR family transcriptional regulator
MKMTVSAKSPGKTRSPKARGSRTDTEQTRAKILDAAGQVFAESGYHAATVRQVCQLAGANVAAVNYHFRDKLGLYTEVLEYAARAAREGIVAALDLKAPPEEVLRAVLRARFQNLFGSDQKDWQFRIMLHELAQPTPAMPRVIDEILWPVFSRMLAIIGKLLGLPSDHEKTRLCHNSILGQILLYPLAWPLLAQVWPELKKTPEQLDRVAEHIADFSLAYLKEEGAKHRAAAGRSKGRRQ